MGNCDARGSIATAFGRFGSPLVFAGLIASLISLRIFAIGRVFGDVRLRARQKLFESRAEEPVVGDIPRFPVPHDRLAGRIEKGERDLRVRRGARPRGSARSRRCRLSRTRGRGLARRWSRLAGRRCCSRLQDRGRQRRGRHRRRCDRRRHEIERLRGGIVSARAGKRANDEDERSLDHGGVGSSLRRINDQSMPCHRLRRQHPALAHLQFEDKALPRLNILRDRRRDGDRKRIAR